jgi:hypothetical protein
VARLDGQTDRVWPTKLGVWQGQNGQHMTPSRHEIFVVLSSWNIRDHITIDRQLGDETSSKVRSSLHNQATAFVFRARLGFSASAEDCASQSRNEKNPVNGIVSWPHASKLFPHSESSTTDLFTVRQHCLNESEQRNLFHTRNLQPTRPPPHGRLIEDKDGKATAEVE